MKAHALSARIGERLLGWVALVVALAGWQVAAEVRHSHSVATFTSALHALGKILSSAQLGADVLPSLYRVLVGFAIAAALGVVIGLFVGTFRALDPWVRPVIEFMRAVPPPLIIPVAMLIIGISGKLIISVIVFGAFWPVLLNTTDGARQVEPVYIETARVFHVARHVMVRSIVLPASLPMIMAGLRIALSTAIIMMVLAEMLASSTGIGYLVLTSQQTFDVPATYGGVLLLGVLGWFFDAAFLAVEQRVLAWNSDFAGGTRV